MIEVMSIRTAIDLHCSRAISVVYCMYGSLVRESFAKACHDYWKSESEEEIQ